MKSFYQMAVSDLSKLRDMLNEAVSHCDDSGNPLQYYREWLESMVKEVEYSIVEYKEKERDNAGN